MFVGRTDDRAIKIYCDESRITACQFILVGGLWIPKRCGQNFVNEYFSRCLTTGIKKPPTHLKWERIPPETTIFFEAYKILFKLFFEYAQRREIFVKVLVAPNYNCSDHQFHQGNYETGFNKLLFLLLRRHLSPLQRYHIRLASRPIQDGQNARTHSEELKSYLNTSWYKHTTGEDVVLSVEHRDEADRILIQMADLIMGAVGFHYCDLHIRPEAQPSKVKIAQAIAHKMRWPSLAIHTLQAQHTINIFKMRTKNREASTTLGFNPFAPE
jgi:hypothetical protein